MNPLDQRTARVLVTILLFAAVLGFIYLARKPLIIFLFAILFAYLLEPIIVRVQPCVRNSRGLAILIVYVIGLALCAGTGLAVGPRIVSEGRSLAHSAPELYQKIVSGNIAWRLEHVGAGVRKPRPAYNSSWQPIGKISSDISADSQAAPQNSPPM